jgi:nicotinate phosphoribosyltransferase
MAQKRKLELATDYYQFSVSNVYFEKGIGDQTAVFDLFIRQNPFHGGYTVFAGLEQVMEYLEEFSFDDEDIEMLGKNHPELSASFLEYLSELRFTGDLYAPPEGELVFPYEPIVKVKAPLIQAQLIETPVLTMINHQSLIATKASRVCAAAAGDGVLEFGLRRAQGTEAGLYGARAALIGGCTGTSNVEAEYLFSSISKGTMSHAYVMSFEDEYTAFEAFAKINPDQILLVVDTYDTLKSGLPNAIKLFDQIKRDKFPHGTLGIRLDSGDLSYLSKQARTMLDDAGHQDAIISASSDLDEYLIADLKAQGAQIDLWGVGTKMITAYETPALGAVYKLSELNGEPKMKISDAPEKITNPGEKKVCRLYDKATHIAQADLIMLADETLDTEQPLRIYHPMFPYKQRELRAFYAEDLLRCAVSEGKRTVPAKAVTELAAYHKHAKEKFWSEFLRFTNPNEFHVDLSDRLYDLKREIMQQHHIQHRGH